MGRYLVLIRGVKGLLVGELRPRVPEALRKRFLRVRLDTSDRGPIYGAPPSSLAEPQNPSKNYGVPTLHGPGHRRVPDEG